MPQLRDFACWGLELRHQTGRPSAEDPEVDEAQSAALRGVPSVRWSCGQRFPAEGAVRRRLA